PARPGRSAIASRSATTADRDTRGVQAMRNRVLDAIMERAEEIRELGPVGERLGRLDERSVRALREAGAIRLLQPAEYGGLEAHPREFAETVMAIAAL